VSPGVKAETRRPQSKIIPIFHSVLFTLYFLANSKGILKTHGSLKQANMRDQRSALCGIKCHRELRAQDCGGTGPSSDTNNGDTFAKSFYMSGVSALINRMGLVIYHLFRVKGGCSVESLSL
jgi:hypothetical protein